MKRWLPLLVAVAGIVVVVAFALDPKRPAAPLEPTLPAYVFGNPLPAAHPPESALRPDVLADPVKRMLARIEWGPPEIFYWTERHLPADPATRNELARGLVRRFEQVIGGSPMLGARFLAALGILGDPDGLGTLVRATETPPTFLQVAAIRALAGFPLTDELRTLYTRLSGGEEGDEVSRAALNEFLKRDVLGDESAIRGFLEVSRGGEAVPWLQQVATRRLVGLADACALHLEGEPPRVRQNAILALLVIGDPRGVAAAREELHTGDLRRIVTGLTLYRDAQLVPPPEESRALSEHPQGEVRRYLAQTLASRGTGADEEVALSILRRLAADSDPVVALAAVESLWKHDRQESVATWRERLRNGHGSELKEAAQVLCEALKDAASAKILRERLSGERLDGVDQANLLYGLRFFADPADLPVFVARMERAGSNDDLRVGDRAWLAESAAIYLQGYGVVATRPLADALARARRPRAQVVLLDALRGVLKGAAAEDAAAAAEQVLPLVVDPAAAPEVRMAALESVPFFDDRGLGDRLLALRAKIDDRLLRERATAIFASFF